MLLITIIGPRQSNSARKSQLIREIQYMIEQKKVIMAWINSEHLGMYKEHLKRDLRALNECIHEHQQEIVELL